MKIIGMKGGKRLRLTTAAAVVVLLVLSLAGIAVSQNYFYTGTWQGGQINLANVPNQTIEGLPDAKLVGQLQSFQTDDPNFTSLNGRSLNVWEAPNEYPGMLVVHNGWQGPQPAYGTWTLPKPASNESAVPMLYKAVWQRKLINLTNVKNVTIEGYPDAQLIGQLNMFLTNDPAFMSLNGKSINVWEAPGECGPGVRVAHNGWQGSQPAYGTWILP